jgi:CheY-like chemotaxis protein
MEERMAPKKILVVDDNPDVVESMTIVLESQGYAVIPASGGKEALDKLQERPDLILLDVMMETETEGLQVAYKIKGEKGEYAQYKDIPIVIITSIHDNMTYRIDDAKGSDYLPVEDFIDKPVQPKQLLEVVRKYLG